MEFAVQLIFWLAVLITIYFIAFNTKLRNPRIFLTACLLSMLFMATGFWGKSNQLWELANGSAFNFLFWFPAYLLSYYFLRKAHLKQTGNDPILVYATRFNTERTAESGDVIFTLLVLTIPTLIVVLLGNILV